MAETILFRGAYIRRCEIRNGEDAREVRVEMTADWTETVREKMEWGEVPHGHGGGYLLGELVASTMQLTPAGRELKEWQLDLNINKVTGFVQVPLKDSEGNTTGRELRFSVRATAEATAAKVEEYCARIGRHAGLLKIKFQHQEELALDPESGSEEETLQAASRFAAIGKEDDEEQDIVANARTRGRR